MTLMILTVMSHLKSTLRNESLAMARRGSAPVAGCSACASSMSARALKCYSLGREHYKQSSYSRGRNKIQEVKQYTADVYDIGLVYNIYDIAASVPIRKQDGGWASCG